MPIPATSLRARHLLSGAAQPLRLTFSRASRRAGTLAFAAMTLAVAAVLVLFPLAIVVTGAFVKSGPNGLELTSAALAAVFGDATYLIAFANTALTSLAAAGIATTIGVALAWILVRTNVPGAALLERLAAVPIFIPPFVGAFAWVLLAAPRIGLLNRLTSAIGLGDLFNIYGYAGIIWVLGIFLAPYVLLLVASALRSMDPSLEEAGLVCGLGRWRTAATITFPVIAPAILSGAVLAFVIAIGLFGTPILLGWSKQIHTVTSRIYIASLEQPPGYGVMAALSVALMAMAAFAMWLQRLALRGRSFVTVTGKGFRSRTIDMGAARYFLLALVCLYLIFTVAGPVCVVAAASISTYTWSGVFTGNYIGYLFSSEDVAETFRNSMMIALTAATAAVLFALCVSWLVHRVRGPGARLLEYLVLMPMSVPGMAFAVGVLFLWSNRVAPLYGTVFILIFAFVGRFAAYAVRTISSSLVQIHTELEESARVCGYGGFGAARRITLPLIWPSIISSWILCYSMFMTELPMSLLLHNTETRTFSILGFDVWYQGNFSKVSALSMLQLIAGVAVMYVVQFVAGRLGRRAG